MNPQCSKNGKFRENPHIDEEKKFVKIHINNLVLAEQVPETPAVPRIKSVKSAFFIFFLQSHLKNFPPKKTTLILYFEAISAATFPNCTFQSTEESYVCGVGSENYFSFKTKKNVSLGKSQKLYLCKLCTKIFTADNIIVQ